MPPPTGPEGRLATARAGSREALGELLEAYRHYLLCVARDRLDPRLSAKGGASDVVQETFREAVRDFPRFVGSTEEEFLAWLRQVLVHNVGRFARRHRDTAKRAAGREVALDPGGAVPASAPTPSVAAAAAEQSSALRDAIARLPDDYRRVILLRHQEEMSFDEIGRAIGRSGEAARKLWARAVERLQADLEGD